MIGIKFGEFVDLFAMVLRLWWWWWRLVIVQQKETQEKEKSEITRMKDIY